MDKNKIIFNDVKDGNKFKFCQICGCYQYVNNFARHRNSKKHQQVDYINNHCFEIKKVKVQDFEKLFKDNQQAEISLLRN